MVFTESCFGTFAFIFAGIVVMKRILQLCSVSNEVYRLGQEMENNVNILTGRTSLVKEERSTIRTWDEVAQLARDFAVVHGGEDNWVVLLEDYVKDLSHSTRS